MIWAIVALVVVVGGGLGALAYFWRKSGRETERLVNMRAAEQRRIYESKEQARVREKYENLKAGAPDSWPDE